MKTFNYLLFVSALFFFVGCGIGSKKAPQGKLSGEFTHRLEMARERLTGNRHKPVFTSDFMLADVNLNPQNPRRFYNYSGDLSGRCIDVLSMYYRGQKNEQLDSLVRNAMTFQQSDGRFGDPGLAFVKEEIDHTHMPLFWGNGRMMVGLLQYYKNTQDPAVLEAARKTGDFFLRSYKEVTPETAARLAGYGSDGIICFTQYTEGLVMLSQATGDAKYAQTAAAIYPTLPDRGNLHSHGYLSTLKGVLDLYEYTGDSTHFDYVRSRYEDLVNSDDFTIYGSVKEYFGGKGDRDEGCSTVDFITLSLHLYKLTNDISYLERAEFAVYNALYFNQFFTGDFGHHRIDHLTSGSNIVHAAWWCCTMAGLKAMIILRNDYFVTNNDGQIKLDLYLDTEYADQNVTLNVRRDGLLDGMNAFSIHFDKIADTGKSLLLRKPSWSESADIFLNGKKIDVPVRGDYFVVEEPVKAGDDLQIRMKYTLRLICPDKTQVMLADVTQPVKGALCYGPYIMAVDNQIDYTFLAEPNTNYVYSNTLAPAVVNDALAQFTGDSFVKDVYLTANYKHDGFPSYYQTVFRPISDMTFYRHPFMMVTLPFVSEAATDANLIDKKNMEAPWMQ